MSLFNKIKQKAFNEFIDIIEWTDDTADTMIWRFPRYQAEIKNGAQLTVRETQVAVLVNEGQFADVFQPGRYELTTSNMPILTTLKGWIFESALGHGKPHYDARPRIWPNSYARIRVVLLSRGIRPYEVYP